MGREQIPRLEAVVDAANVEILEGGDGYRENPDLVFWYGSEKNKDDLSESFPNINALEGNFTESNGTNGMLAYVEDEEKVYSFYGNSTKRTYSWRPGSVCQQEAGVPLLMQKE